MSVIRSAGARRLDGSQRRGECMDFDHATARPRALAG
jgi:hypothetical protein